MSDTRGDADLEAAEASCEQMARDILERIGVPDAQTYSAGCLVELANLIDERARLAAALELATEANRLASARPFSTRIEDYLRRHKA